MLPGPVEADGARGFGLRLPLCFPNAFSPVEPSVRSSAPECDVGVIVSGCGRPLSCQTDHSAASNCGMESAHLLREQRNATKNHDELTDTALRGSPDHLHQQLTIKTCSTFLLRPEERARAAKRRPRLSELGSACASKPPFRVTTSGSWTSKFARLSGLPLVPSSRTSPNLKVSVPK